MGDKFYLLASKRLFLSMYEWEPYIEGRPLYRYLEKEEGFLEVLPRLLDKRYGDFYRAASQVNWVGDGLMNLLWLAQGFNIYTPIHIIYILSRASGYGLYRSVREVFDLSIPEACRALELGEAILRGSGDRRRYGSIDVVVKPPLWVKELVRIFVANKVIDKGMGRRIREAYKTGYMFWGDPFLKVISNQYGLEVGIQSYILPKIAFAEALYREASPRLDDLIIDVYYTGLLGDDVLRKVSDE